MHGPIEHEEFCAKLRQENKTPEEITQGQSQIHMGQRMPKRV